MKQKELERYREQAFQVGVLSDDGHRVMGDRRIVHTRAEEMTFGQALSSALSTSEIVTSFFIAGVEKGLIKLRY